MLDPEERDRLVRIEEKVDGLHSTLKAFGARIGAVEGKVWGVTLLILGASVTVIAILAG